MEQFSLCMSCASFLVIFLAQNGHIKVIFLAKNWSFIGHILKNLESSKELGALGMVIPPLSARVGYGYSSPG